MNKGIDEFDFDKLLKGKQKIMAKYTRLVMKRLYNGEVYVFFDNSFHRYRGTFRDKWLPYAGVYIPPDLVSKINYDEILKIWIKKPRCSITFDNTLYKANSLALHAWDTIVHEVTHYEGGIKSDENMVRFHTDEFRKNLRKNFQKVDDLRKKFYEEVDWDEDFIFEDEEDYK
ncbi:MAG: hypothetical protein DRN27_04940 [Thermoplasmata archaeon]|nr:MAG: hypothetical protein DRN27_04940 [Thermoplasmata archaeon]